MNTYMLALTSIHCSCYVEDVLYLMWLSTGTSDGFSEHSSEPVGSIKYREFLDCLRNC